MSVWLPMLPIDLFRRRMRRSGERSEGAFVLLVETVAQRQIVAHACPRARAAGIQPGIALSAARAALGPEGLIVEPHDAHRTARALRAFALWCHRFSPVVALEDTEGVCLDITGGAHLFGGEASMIERVRAEACRLGVETRVAIAPTFAAARALARWGSDRAIVERPDLASSLRELPVHALDIDPDAIEGLAEVNVTRIGSLIDLPRPAVAGRFGADVLAALDRMLGRVPERIEPLRPLEALRADRAFDGPCTDLVAIGLACRELLEQLGAALAARERGVTEWSLVLGRSDMEPLTLALRHCAPSREPRHLWRLLEPRLERAHLGFGVESLAIIALRTGRIRHHQSAWWNDTPAAAADASAADGLIDALVNRLGPGAVFRAELRASRVPERAFSLRSVLEPAPAITSVELVESDRPTRLFDPPQLARVIALSPDGPVSHLQWNGGAHRMIASIGPERIKGEWWLGDRFVRDYFRVQDEHGLWIWVYREEPSGQWFVHGVWE
ncbi:MAG: DNA polymerase Y family protein [Phycisphaerae bacterium]|nr:DNA polymerase Y family protein [Phycisphaerae bacterium]